MIPVPDSIDPVRGWRAWGLCSPTQAPAWQLTSIAQIGWTWPARQPARASCRECPQAPRWACSCGLHAFRDAPSLREVWMPDPLGDAPAVMGQVLGWGRVVEHERGWRAERAYPVSLSLLCSSCLIYQGRVVPATVVRVLRNWRDALAAFPECDACAGERNRHPDRRRERPDEAPAHVVEAQLRERYGAGAAPFSDQLAETLYDP